MRSSKAVLNHIAVRVRQQRHEFNPLWLRLNDPGSHTKNKQRMFEISAVVQNPESSKVVRHIEDEVKGLEIEWADGHRSIFPLKWLEAQAKPKQLDAEFWHHKFAKLVPEVDFSDLGGEGKTRLSVYLARYGLAIVKNVPVKPGMVENVGNLLGHVRETNYGTLFDVIDKGADGNNLAQTNCQILSHTDNPYRDPFPGVQLLHCLQNASDGGATTFVDGFAAAEDLRKDDPAAFQLLSETPHPYEYLDPETNVCLRTEVPVLSLDAYGAVVRVAFNNRSAAPLQRPSDQVEAYYRAWAKFDALCNDEERLVRIPLQPGDLAIFMNSRVMHGRDGYAASGPRHIQGTYIDHDALRSHVSMALSSGAGVGQMCVFQQTTAKCLEALESQAQLSYGEGINMLQHGLQVAAIADASGEPPEAILACLFHDVGNSPQARQAWSEIGNAEPQLLRSPSDGSIGYSNHCAVGANFLESSGFSATVAEAVRLHVNAKRALVAMDASYMQELSQASIDTLAAQGGPMSAEELVMFHATPGADIALRLRRYDDLGKEVGKTVPDLEYYRELIAEHLRTQVLRP